jgi:UDPglucose 6-dehydrogenase
VRAWDPIARPSDLDGVELFDTVDEALAGADAAVLVTEWPQLADVDWAAAAASMQTAVFVDGRNMLSPQSMRKLGWTYEGIGRTPEDGAG